MKQKRVYTWIYICFVIPSQRPNTPWMLSSETEAEYTLAKKNYIVFTCLLIPITGSARNFSEWGIFPIPESENSWDCKELSK